MRASTTCCPRAAGRRASTCSGKSARSCARACPGWAKTDMRGALYGIATEGWPFVIALAVIAAWMLHAGSAYAAIPLVGAVMAVLKFRDPQREVPADPHGIVSPVDGQLIEIRPVRSEERRVGTEWGSTARP